MLRYKPFRKSTDSLHFVVVCPARGLSPLANDCELQRSEHLTPLTSSRTNKHTTPRVCIVGADIGNVGYSSKENDCYRALGACSENVVKYISVGCPSRNGWPGPLIVDGTLYPIPMAMAQGTLVASTSLGCEALNAVTTVIVEDAMTSGPAIDSPPVAMASEAKAWIASGGL